MPSEFEEVLTMEAGVVPAPYEMEYYDKDSINEIKKMIANNLYQDANTIQEHLLFLEHLAGKLQQALSAEQGRGESAWNLRKNIDEVKNIFNVLSSLKNRFSRAS